MRGHPQPAGRRDRPHVHGHLQRRHPAGHAQVEHCRRQRVDHQQQGQRVRLTAVGEPHPGPHLCLSGRTAVRPADVVGMDQRLEALGNGHRYAAGKPDPAAEAVHRRRQVWRRRGDRLWAADDGEVAVAGQHAQSLLVVLAQRGGGRGQRSAAAYRFDLDRDRPLDRRGQEVAGDRERVAVRRQRLGHRPGADGEQVTAVGEVRNAPAPGHRRGVAAATAGLPGRPHRRVVVELAARHASDSGRASADALVERHRLLGDRGPAEVLDRAPPPGLAHPPRPLGIGQQRVDGGGHRGDEAGRVLR